MSTDHAASIWSTLAAMFTGRLAELKPHLQPPLLKPSPSTKPFAAREERRGHQRQHSTDLAPAACRTIPLLVTAAREALSSVPRRDEDAAALLTVLGAQGQLAE